MTPPDKPKIFDVAADVRKFEIDLFWRRSIFFWGFIAASFIAYSAIATRSDAPTELLIAVSSFGLVCSIAWTLANRASKFWQEAWEAKLETLEKDVLGIDLFKAKFTPTDWYFWGAHRYSVSRLAIALSDFTVLLWVYLLARAALDMEVETIMDPSVLIPIFTLGYIVAMFIWGRSRS